MNICVRPPTKTEMEACSRRQRFAASIAAKAAELERKKLIAEMAPVIPVAVQPEAIPAEPDPPPTCPVCAEKAARIVAAAKPPERDYPLIADIQRAVSRFYGVTRADMCSPRRAGDLLIPRWVAIYIAKEITPVSLIGIGRIVCRDHTTIIHSNRKIAALIYADAEFALEVVSLMSEIRGD